MLLFWTVEAQIWLPFMRNAAIIAFRLCHRCSWIKPIQINLNVIFTMEQFSLFHFTLANFYMNHIWITNNADCKVVFWASNKTPNQSQRGRTFFLVSMSRQKKLHHKSVNDLQKLCLLCFWWWHTDCRMEYSDCKRNRCHTSTEQWNTLFI